MAAVMRAALAMCLLATAAAAQDLPRAIAAGETMASQLDATDPSLSDGSYFEDWVYQGTSGERLRIIMRSSDFDVFLSIGTLAGGEWDDITSDDDSAGGTDAMIEIRLPRDGEFVIRANSVSRVKTGSYTLRIQSQR